MIVGEPFLKSFFENGFIKYGFEILVVATVLTVGHLKKKNKGKEVLQEEE